jgi:radical SAM superfamily enzyme
VGKINFMDPVFNMGREYLELMQHMADIRLGSQIALQTRFELIRNSEGERFLDLAAELGAHLEFGLQTAAEDEGKTINRRNRSDAVESALHRIRDRGISFEVSLIYGLPGQTVRSFRESIDFLQRNGCERIVAWPLMLLRGTELHGQREQWGYRERPMGRFGIPVAYQSASFTEAEWHQMRVIAEGLASHSRV